MRDRLLVRHFLWRFLEHDFISANADRREALSASGGILIAVSLFVSVLTALKYQFENFMPPGIASLRFIDDRFMFVSASMLVMALLAAALWDALALDVRDAAVLGILPVPRSAIIRSKFIAVAILAAGTDLAWNFAPILLRSWSLPLMLRVGNTGALVLTLSQALVTLAAGAFGFLSVLAIREGLAAVLGRERFRSISSAIQVALLVMLTSGLLLLPGASTDVARTWIARDDVVTKSFPPLWFVGLHETLAGSVIDRLPHTSRGPLGPLFAAPERDAARLYRSLWPQYRRLGRAAVTSLPIVALLAVAACAWNSRRLPAPVVHRRRDMRHLKQAWRWMVTHLLAPSAIQQAGFRFTLQTLPRRLTHRAVLASATAIGLSLMIITVGSQALTGRQDVATAPLGILAAQSLVLASVLTGFHRAVQLPAELRASSTFSLAWSGELRPYVSGVKRAGWIAVVLPALAGLFVWHSVLLGIRVAMLHACLGLAVSALLMELLFARYVRVPLVSGYLPSADLKSRGVAYVAAVLLASFALAGIERAALGATAYFALLSSAIGGLSAAVSTYSRALDQLPVALDLDEEPALPTQRLNLAG